MGVLHCALWTTQCIVGGGEGICIFAREVDLTWPARCAGEGLIHGRSAARKVVAGLRLVVGMVERVAIDYE